MHTPNIFNHYGTSPYGGGSGPLAVGPGMGLPHAQPAIAPQPWGGMPSGGAGIGPGRPGNGGRPPSRPTPAQVGHAASHPGGQGPTAPRTINGTPVTPIQLPLYLSGGEDAINAATRDYTHQMADNQQAYGKAVQGLGYSTTIDPKTHQLQVGGFASYGENPNGAYQTISRDALNRSLSNGFALGSGIDTQGQGYLKGMDQLGQDKANANYGFASGNQASLSNYYNAVAGAYSGAARYGVDHRLFGTPTAAASAAAGWNAGGKYFPVPGNPGGGGGRL